MSKATSLLRKMRLTILAATAIACAPCAVTAAPVTTHPRLWIGGADLPRLGGWANASNPMYAQGLYAAATAGKAYADANWNWTTGKPKTSWRDDGSTNWEADATEAYAELFAFMSLVDSDQSMRPQWAMRARVMLMHIMNNAALGAAANKPFRDPAFATYNRASYWGEAFGLTVDWIYPYLSASDKATIRKVFLRWASEILVASTAGEEHPQPVGVVNDLQLLGSSPSQSTSDQEAAQLQLRWAANNYFIAHSRNLALMALSFDAADDPAVNSSKPASQIGNSLRSYISDVTGAWLYQTYALFEQPAIVAQALNVPTGNHDLGLASGGLPVEGALYGGSVGVLFQYLLALHTSGYADPAISGPQVNLLTSSYWDEALNGFLNTITPTPYTPSQQSGYGYLGPIYQPANYGDVLNFWIEGDYIGLFGPLGAYDVTTNNAPRLNKERWLSQNVLQGGAGALYQRAGDIWGNSYASYSIFYFLLFDPAAAAPVDPRPSLPPFFVAPSIDRILARTDWTPNASWFDFRCSWEWINHEGGDCGQFEYYRKGVWLIKEWSGYAIDWSAYAPIYHNTLSLQNHQPANESPGDLYWPIVIYGGQWHNGGNNGDPAIAYSVSDQWAYGQADATNLYNHPEIWIAADAAMDIEHASRSIVWLNPDAIVIYDRAISSTSPLFKRENFVLTASPSISGKVAHVTNGGQQLIIQSLLPADATLTEQHFWKTDPSQEFDAVAGLDPSYDRLIIDDPAKPAATQFLTVLQGADASAQIAPAVAIKGTSPSTTFDGAVVAGTAVLFPTTFGTSVQSLVYTAPATVTRHLVTGLIPGQGYNVSVAQVAGGQKLTISLGSQHTADAAGVLAIGFPASANPPVAGAKPGWTLN